MDKLLSQAVTSQLSDAVSEKFGLSKSDSKNAVENAIPVLLGGLTKNSQSGSGAEDILSALSKDHDGSILDHVSKAAKQKSTTDEGAKIVDHILGNKQKLASKKIGDETSIDPALMLKIFALIAPFVMGSLGKKNAKSGLDAGSLSGILGTILADSGGKKNSNVLSQILDQNNNGTMLDEVIDIGGSLLGGMLKKK